MVKYLYLLVVIITMFIGFSMVVFMGESKRFSVQEKHYIKSFDIIKANYWEQLPELESRIKKILNSSRNQKIIRAVIKKNKYVKSNLQLGNRLTANILVLNKYKKIIYVQNKGKFKSRYKEAYSAIKVDQLIIAPNGYLAYKKKYRNKSSHGFIIFEFDLEDIMAKVFEISGYDREKGNYYFENNSFIFYEGTESVPPANLDKKLKECIETEAEICKYYFIKEKKTLINYRLSSAGVRGGFLYDSNFSDLPTISIIVFVFLFLIIIFLFIVLFIHQNYQFNILHVKKWLTPKLLYSILPFSKSATLGKGDEKKEQVDEELTNLFDEINTQENRIQAIGKVNRESQVSETKTEKEQVDIKMEESKEEDSEVDTEEVVSQPDDFVVLSDDISSLNEKLEEELKVKEGQKEQESEEEKEVPPQQLPVSGNDREKVGHYLRMANGVLKGRESMMELDREDQIAYLKDRLTSLASYQVGEAIIFAHQVDRYEVVDTIGYDEGDLNNFKIYQDQNIYLQYFQKNQGVLIKNGHNQSQFLQAYLSPEKFDSLQELFFLPIQLNDDVEFILAFNEKE